MSYHIELLTADKQVKSIRYQLRNKNSLNSGWRAICVAEESLGNQGETLEFEEYRG